MNRSGRPAQVLVVPRGTRSTEPARSRSLVTLPVAAFLALISLLAACSGSVIPAGPTPTPFVPAATPAPTPEPGPGVVTFGTKIDDTTLAIVDPKTAFTRGVPAIAWSASLNEPAAAAKVTVVFAKRFSGGSETVLDATDVSLSNPASDTIANTEDLAAIAGNKAGTYVLRILRDATVLAEGSFTLK